MMAAAVDAARQGGAARPKLLGVTVLTSLNDKDLFALGVAASAAEQVRRLALMAKASGLDGVVCAPGEAAALRTLAGNDFVLAVPGLRPTGALPDDQKRTMTPRAAAKAGADIVVIGRPITGAKDPAAAARAIAAEMAA